MQMTMADLNAALLAFASVLVGGYFNNFMAEDYRRFRDSQALAAAIAGELESHGAPIRTTRKFLGQIASSTPETTSTIAEWPVPGSPIFDGKRREDRTAQSRKREGRSVCL